MAIFRSLKTLISQSLRNHSNCSTSRAFFSLPTSCPSPIQTPFLLPSDGYIRRHFLFRSRFLSPVGGPLFLFNPPWKLSQSATPLLLQSDAVLNFLKLRALNLINKQAFPCNLEYDAPRLLNESDSGNGAEGGAVAGESGISESYLNLPNFISLTRLLSGPLLGCKLRSLVLLRHRLFCTSKPGLDSKTLPSSRDRSRATLSLIRFEKNPERIIDICRSAALSPESHIDRIAYAKAISKLRESNHYEGIRKFIKETMNQLDCKNERFVSHFIILYGHGGLISDAVKLFDEMPGMGVERNVKTLNSLLFSCDLAGEYGELKRVFSEFPRKYGLAPNLDSYNTVLKGFCQSDRAKEAHSMLADMERKGIKPNVTTFATIIAGFYMEENYSDVGKMMQLMKKYGMQPGISIYNVRIQSLCKLKRSSEAKALFDGILSRGMKPNCATYSHLIYGFCREGKLDQAKSLFKEMVDRGLNPEAECYFTLVYYLCRGRDFEVALDVCEDCMAKGWVPNITTMRILVDGLVSIGKVNNAREIIRQMKKRFWRNAHRWSEIEEGLPG